MKMADFFSRQYMDAPKYRLKMPTECDLAKCKLLDSKLDKTNCYTAAKTMYVIDRLANESAETLCDMKPGSYGINDEGEVCYISVTSKKLVKSISGKNPQSVMSCRGPDCSQSGADALSVYAVRNHCDVSDTGSESEEEEKLDKNEGAGSECASMLMPKDQTAFLMTTATLNYIPVNSEKLYQVNSYMHTTSHLCLN